MPMDVVFIDELDLRGKTVFVRADFNVPLDEQQQITDETRIRATLPTLQYVLDQGGALVAASHLGRPRGKRVAQLSMQPVARCLERLLDRPVQLAPDCIGPDVAAMVTRLAPGQVLLLENLRFHAGENANDEAFSRQLMAGVDVFINDAFAVSHRSHASVAAAARCAPCRAAGFLMKEEVVNFRRAMIDPERPMVAIIGGAKVSGKLEVLEFILDRLDVLLVGGGMAFTFLKAQGLEVGSSLVEDDLLDIACSIMDKAAAGGKRIVLPRDCVAASDFDPEADNRVVAVSEIPAGWMGLDIGPATVADFTREIMAARTVVWNGPMGVFEMEPFSRGTLGVADAVAASPALSVVGGGDTDAALNMAGRADGVSFMSTAGGAFIEMMKGVPLPGIEALCR